MDFAVLIIAMCLSILCWFYLIYFNYWLFLDFISKRNKEKNYLVESVMAPTLTLRLIKMINHIQKLNKKKKMNKNEKIELASKKMMKWKKKKNNDKKCPQGNKKEMKKEKNKLKEEKDKNKILMEQEVLLKNHQHSYVG